MLCSAHDIGWSDKADGVLVVMPDDAQPGDACPADPPKVRIRNCAMDTRMHRTDNEKLCCQVDLATSIEDSQPLKDP